MPTDRAALCPDDRRIVVALFAALWATYALIGPGFMVLNDNSISRMGYVLTLIQDHIASIDAIADFTVDKAELDGHFYLDKAPGLSLMALPFVAIMEFVSRMAGFDTALVADGQLSLYYILVTTLTTILTVAPLSAAGGAALYVIARRVGAERGGALFATLAFALCTPGFGYATVFFSHAATGACLVLGLLAVLIASDAADPRQARIHGALAGAVLSWSMVIEYTAGAGVAVIALAGLWRLRQRPARQVWTILACVVAGGVLAAIPMGVYNTMVFGGVTQVGYSRMVGFEGMQRGLFGVVWPDPNVAALLLIGSKRGLLLLSPLLVLAPLAWFASRRLPAEMLALTIAIPLIFLAVNAGYAYWDGGASTGPRHLTAALPFLALAFAPLWDHAGRPMRTLLLALAALSLAISTLCATTVMGAPIWDDNPLPNYIWPRFASGDTHNILAIAGDAGHRWLGILLLPWLIAARSVGLLPASRRIAGAPATA